MIGVPGTTSSPRLGNIVEICPASGAVRRIDKEGGHLIYCTACKSTMLRADARSSLCAPSTAIWYCS